MHFRVRKNVVQLVRMVYRPELKRGQAEVMGSVRLANPILDDAVREQLTAEEIQEFEQWLATKHHVDSLEQELAALTLPEVLQRTEAWFAREGDTVKARAAAAQITASWQSLRRLMMKQGLLD